MILDIPPQIELQIVEIAKQQNKSANAYILSKLGDDLVLPEYLSETDKELFYLTGIIPFNTKNPVTNDMVNALREEYGI